MKALFFRSIWLPAIVTAVLLLIALSLLLSMSWRSLKRLEPMHQHLAVVSHVQATGLRLQEILLRSIHGDSPVDVAELVPLRIDINRILSVDADLSRDSRGRLQAVSILLTQLAPTPRLALITSLGLMRRVLSDETRAHDQLLAHIKHDTTIEFEVAASIMVTFPILALLTIFLLRHRIVTPLNDLRTLMSLLAQQDYTPAATADVDPMLLPLFLNYNHMVGRLAELEQSHQARQQSLENEVRAATGTLLLQQRNLANAERLAAVGEVAAGLAHELRNPLAGIQVALGNLRNEMQNPDQGERLDLVTTELKRITRLLNDLLNQARQAPEPPRRLRLAQLVDQLYSLARYQLPPDIRLEHGILADMECSLPEGSLRQALLNLVLNSAQAIGTDRAGVIRMEADLSPQRLLLSVCDDGPGFPQELLESGVRPFASGREHGTGLGLAMVRRFASDLNGQLRLNNREPHGACAVLDLPCKESNNV